MSGPALPPIGDRLRQARVRRGITVRGLARQVDVSASLISQIETGKSSPSVSTLYAITAALDISIEDVFGEHDAAARAANGTAAPALPAVQAPAPVVTPAAVPAPAWVPPVVSVPSTPLPTAPLPTIPLPTIPLPTIPLPTIPFAEPEPPNGNGAALRVSQERPGESAVAQGLRQLARKRRVGPVVTAGGRETLRLDSGVTWELLGQLPDTHVDFLRITYQPGGSSSGMGVLMRHSGTEWGHVLSGQLTLTLGFDTYVLNPGDSVSFDCSTPHSYANHGTEPAIGIWFVAERYR